MKRTLLLALVAGISFAQDKPAYDKQPAVWLTGLNFGRMSETPTVDMFEDGIRFIKLQNADMKCDADACTSSPVTCKITKDTFECSGSASMGFEIDLNTHSDGANWKPLGISLGVESIGLFVSHKMVAYIDHRDSLWMLYGTDQRLLSNWDDLNAAKAEAERLFADPPVSPFCEHHLFCGTATPASVAPAVQYGGALAPSCCNAGPAKFGVQTLESINPLMIGPSTMQTTPLISGSGGSCLGANGYAVPCK